MSDQSPDAFGSDEYVRFIILCSARSGSNLLASSLNTSPSITCFRELFGMAAGFIDFNVDGYDRDSAEDRALRDRDFKAFLRERIFCNHPHEVRAVGFKMPYDHFRWFPGLLEWLVEDRKLHVLHLQRQNMLRMLVSLRVAQMTGGWVEDRKVPLPSELKPAMLLRAARHPLRSAALLRKILWPKEAPWKARRAPLALSRDDCLAFFSSAQRDVALYSSRFHGHPLLTVYYEDLLRDRKRAFIQVQSFLGIDPTALGVATRRQNPEPLHQLLANYEELKAAFEHTPYAAFFD